MVDNVHSTHPLTLPSVVQRSYLDCGNSSQNHPLKTLLAMHHMVHTTHIDILMTNGNPAVVV